MSLLIWWMRRSFKRNDAKRDAGLTVPDNVQRFVDISYGPHGRWNTLDVYRPKDAEGKLPVIVSVHGGGWFYGDKELYQYYCMSLVQHGFAVVNFSYRLAPENRFPAALEDTNAVFCWLLEHADEYALDTGRVFGVGDSAGAQILGLYACACTDPAYAASLPIRPPEGFALKAVALNCGVYHVEPGERNAIVKAMFHGNPTKEQLDRVSVLNHANASFPPSCVMTGEGDFLAEAAPPMAERLRELGVQVEYRFYGDAQHPLGHVFHCNLYLDEAKRCNADECAFFQSYC